MEKNEINEKNEDISNILKEKYKYSNNVNFKNYFHLNEKGIYILHNQYSCSYIIKHNISSNIFLALKHASTGEGYIFDKQNKLYIKSHSQMISKLLIDYKNNYLISCSYDKNINIYDLSKMNKTSNILNTLKGHKGRIYDMDLVENKDELLSCGMDKIILLWYIKNFTLIKQMK